MDAKLDWVSFTFAWENVDTDNDKQAYLLVEDALEATVGEGGFKLLLEGQQWEFGKGRKPYSCSVGGGNGVRIYFNHKINHALVEISGEGCSRVFSSPGGEYLLQSVKDRVTRIDIAVDMQCDVMPSEFVSHRSATRHKSFSHVVSDTGETCYIGSMSSNRYARVYRYNEPHPRSGLLRAEHVFRQEDAKRVVEFGFENGIDKLVQEAGAIFGWTHDAWDFEPPTVRELKAHREEREDAATVKWLYDTVAPSIARLAKSGKLDVKAFLSHLYRKLKEDDGSSPVAQITD